MEPFKESPDDGGDLPPQITSSRCKWQDKEEEEEEADESDHIGTHFLETPEQQA